MRDGTGNQIDFSQAEALEQVHKLPMPGGKVSYRPRFELGQSTADVFRYLLNTVAWREEHITLFGKRYLQPRQFAWYGDAHASYQYSGLRLSPEPWLPELAKLRQQLQQHCGCKFNSVLLNHYRDERDSMGMHADDEQELGPQPVIASLSLGEQRTLIFKHRHRKDLKALKLTLEDGSLLVMRGHTQENWKHGINKQSTPCGPRINLTFRHIKYT